MLALSFSGFDPELTSQARVAQLRLTSRPKCPSVPKSKEIIYLALSPAVVLSRERIDTGIDADVANKEIRALDEVGYLINISPAETTFVNCHLSRSVAAAGVIFVFCSPSASNLV